MSKLLLAIICLMIGTTLGVIFTAMIVAGGIADEQEEKYRGRSDDGQARDLH